MLRADSAGPQPFRRRRISVLTLAALPVTVPGLVTLPTVTFAADPEPVPPLVHQVPLIDAAMRAGGKSVPAVPGAAGEHSPVISTPALDVEPFRLVAVTWAGTAADVDLVAWVRTRTADTWSGWFQLPAGGEHGPDPDSAEAGSIRLGTDPLVVKESDGVEVRVGTADGTIPDDLRLDLIDPGIASADADIGRLDTSAAAAAVSRPTIYTRAAWGADESLREPGPPDYGEVNGAFVHHTVNANTYSAADVPAIIRGIYAYHVNSRGWRDIGYNFLVDRFGRIWEGRFGGVDQAVIGAHTQGYNDDAFAMSAIGTYTSQEPEAALLIAYQQLFAWKFSIHGVDPRYSVNYDGETWPAIAGHRDAAATECPGQRLYDALPTIRTGVTVLMFPPVAGIGWRDFNGDRLDDLMARRRTDGSLWLWRGVLGLGYRSAVQIGANWTGLSNIVRPGDWDGDGAQDVIVRVTSSGQLRLYPRTSGGGFGPPRVIGTGWGSVRGIYGPGDLNGDGVMDLLAHFTDGSLWLYPGDGHGAFRPRVQVGHGWGASMMLVTPGDWNGDGRHDLLARHSDGSLWLYPGTDRSSFAAARKIGVGWNPFSTISGSGDVDKDGKPDLLAWTASGQLVLYPGSGTGGFRRSVILGGGWAAYDQRG